MPRLPAVLFAAALWLAAVDARAGIIHVADTRLSTTSLVTFELPGIVKDSTAITGQYASQGLLFSGDIRINGCGNNNFNRRGLSGSYLNTFGPNCYTNQIADSFSMTFATPVSRLSMSVIAGDSNRDDMFSLFYQGAEVASFQLMALPLDSVYCASLPCSQYDPPLVEAFLNIDGIVFDQLRFTENVTLDASYLVIDNLGFTPVPEPATAALVAAALCGWLAGLAFIRRSRAARRARVRETAGRTWSGFRS